MSLIDILSRDAVPHASSLDTLRAFGDGLLAQVDSADLGDAAQVTAAALDCAPEFVALADAAARAGDPHAPTLLKTAADTLPDLPNLVFKDAADVALASNALVAAHAEGIAEALRTCVRATRGTNGLRAFDCLEVLTRLGLLHSSGRLKAVDLMLSVTLGDSAELLERLPRLVGLAWEQWHEAELEQRLRLLLEHDASRADALFELGQGELRAALNQGSVADIVAGLVAARTAFGTVETQYEAREDAATYRCALDIVIAFTGAATGTASNVADSTAALEAAVEYRTMMVTRWSHADWTRPRPQAEAEWCELATALSGITGPLQEPSWITPVETLIRILAAVQSTRSLTVVDADGVLRVLEPTINAAFLRREGLLGHLRAVIASGELPDDLVPEAKALLAALTSPGASGADALGKVLVAVPDLATELGINAQSEGLDELAVTIERSPRVAAWLNTSARARARALERGKDPVVDGLLDHVLNDLASCPGFTGTAREEFVEVIVHVLRFAADRANVTRGSGGADIAYLFPPEPGQVFLEAHLQHDLFSWLSNSGLRRGARREEPDVGAGRADITVTFDHRVVLEIKREQYDASFESITRAHADQAAAYSVVGVPLSIEVVLDLTDHRGGVPSLAESVRVLAVPVANAASRHVVAVVVRGNRPTPRETRGAR